MVDGWFALAEARYFLTPDFRVEGHVGVELQSTYDTYDAVPDRMPQISWNAGIGAEYKLADMPFSVFAKYDYFDLTWDDSEYSRERHRLLLG